jgi:hypothetical protein
MAVTRWWVSQPLWRFGVAGRLSRAPVGCARGSLMSGPDSRCLSQVAHTLHAAARVVGVELPITYLYRVVALGLEHDPDVRASRLGRGVVLVTVPESRSRLPIVVGYADDRGQWYRDGTRHVEAPAVDGQSEAATVGL